MHTNTACCTTVRAISGIMASNSTVLSAQRYSTYHEHLQYNMQHSMLQHIPRAPPEQHAAQHATVHTTSAFNAFSTLCPPYNRLQYLTMHAIMASNSQCPQHSMSHTCTRASITHRPQHIMLQNVPSAPPTHTYTMRRPGTRGPGRTGRQRAASTPLEPRSYT